MKLLTRDQHCDLAGIDIEAFKSLQRRDLLPTCDGDEESLGYKKLGYTPYETLLLLVANALADELSLSRARAKEIAARNFGTLCQEWCSLRQTSAELASGTTPVTEILLGEIGLPNGKNEIVCDIFNRIASKFPAARHVTLVNVSRVAAGMRTRASHLKIDLDEFWSWNPPECVTPTGDPPGTIPDRTVGSKKDRDESDKKSGRNVAA